MTKELRRPTTFPFLRFGLLAICAVSISAMASSLLPDHEKDGAVAVHAGKVDANIVASAPARNQNQPNLAQQVNGFLGLAESRLVHIDLTNAVPGAPLTVQIADPVQPMTLEMYPYHIRSESYQLLGIGADNNPMPFDPGPERTLRGRVHEIPGAHVAGSLMSDGLYAAIYMPDGQRVWIEAVGQRMGLADTSLHVIYDNCSALPSGKSCGMDGPGVEIDENAAPPQDAVAGAGGGTICIAELANDCDFEFFQAHGSTVQSAQDRIELVMNTTNVQYETEVGITHIITTTLVRFAEPDPYTAVTNNELLCQFVNEWVNHQSSIQRDVAQLWTGKEITGSVIGQAANIGNICDDPPGCTTFPCQCGQFGTDGSYCFVQSDFNNTFSCSTDLSAHELGHLWGGVHCSCPSNTMNPSITCTNFFGATTSAMIVAYRNTRQCIDCQSPLVFDFPNGIPLSIDPNGGTAVRVNVTQGSQAPMPGTGLLHYSTGGSYTTVPMTVISPTEYDAVFSAIPCGTTVKFYVSAETTGGMEQNDPLSAPTGSFTTTSGYAVFVRFEDNFEANMGWTIGNGAGLTTGAWQRAVPNGGGVRGDPAIDADGSGSCFVTQNGAGDTDVDGGSTTLFSPVMDASGGIAFVSYYRWFSNDFGGEPMTEPFTVQVTDDGGTTWHDLEVVGPTGSEVSGGWFHEQFDITSAGIAATNQFRIRFIAQDPDPGSIIEAGVDGVRLVVVDCAPPNGCIADFVSTGTLMPPGDGTVNGADLGFLLDQWGPNPGSPADIVDDGTLLPPGDGVVNGGDLGVLLDAWGDCP